jgi:hypothetical protein
MASVSIATTLAAFGLGAAWRFEHDRNGRLTAELAVARREARPALAVPYRSNPPEVVASEPLDPSSYLALSRRIVDGRIDFDPPRRPAAPSDDKPPRPRPEPLRVGDRDRLLDL